jgi:lipid A ethanolaminephosphotransferase
MSEHGESPGESGLFLHGLPYRMAPEVQKYVPMVAWFGSSLREREKLAVDCLGADRHTEPTHDNLHHIVLGVMEVRSPSFKPALDAFAKRRAARPAA